MCRQTIEHHRRRNANRLYVWRYRPAHRNGYRCKIIRPSSDGLLFCLSAIDKLYIRAALKSSDANAVVPDINKNRQNQTPRIRAPIYNLNYITAQENYLVLSSSNASANLIINGKVFRLIKPPIPRGLIFLTNTTESSGISNVNVILAPLFQYLYPNK